MPQAVRFLSPAFPFQKGDETTLDDKTALSFKDAKVVEFIGPAKKAASVEPPAPPYSPEVSAGAAEETSEAPADEKPPVEIPDGWEGLHHQKIMSLARSITGISYASVADAKGTIKDELARRASAGE